MFQPASASRWPRDSRRRELRRTRDGDRRGRLSLLGQEEISADGCFASFPDLAVMLSWTDLPIEANCQEAQVRLKKIWIVLVIAGVTPSKADAFETTGLAWCDSMLANYERCLQSVTRERCEFIARRDKRSATYQQPGPAGAYFGSRTFPTAADACLAEIQDLIGEQRLHVTVIGMAKGKEKEKACRGLRPLVMRNSRSLCGK